MCLAKKKLAAKEKLHGSRYAPLKIHPFLRLPSTSVCFVKLCHPYMLYLPLTQTNAILSNKTTINIKISVSRERIEGTLTNERSK